MNKYHSSGTKWKNRCPKCFSRDLQWSGHGPNTRRQCRNCNATFDMDDAKLTMPVDGYCLDVPRGAEIALG